MSRRNPFFIALVALIAGAIVFTITLTARATRSSESDPSQDGLLDWLGVNVNQRQALRDHDPSFDQDLTRLRAELDSARHDLAKALDGPGTKNEQLRQCSEATIAANAALERRVMDHLLVLRDHLTPAQQRQLFNLCAEGVRQGQGWRWRRGKDATPSSTAPGRGPARSRDGNGNRPVDR